ncbi:hypothetical protein [Bandra megavirus]|uniref:Uncharacterized protein n=1 Tax=Bandra megavirus TaxID=2071566 RepID=A0A2K9V8H2_9VIRU|nr:hypothetical protein [Bandra megavirus]
MNNTTLIDNIDIIEIADDIDNYDENIKLQDEIDDTELMDPFIGKKNIDMDKPINPFYLNSQGSEFKFSKSRDLVQEYNGMYILCLSNDFMSNDKNNNLISLFFETDSDINELKHQSKLVTLVKCPNSILYLNVRESLINVEKNILEYFNHESYELGDNELVYLMLETKEKNVKKWIKNHSLEGDMKHIKNFVEKKIFSSYYQLHDNKLDQSAISDLNNSPMFKYWQSQYNCNISSNTVFSTRKFNIPNVNKWNLPYETIENYLHKILVNFKENKSELNAGGYPPQITNNDKYIFSKKYLKINEKSIRQHIDKDSKYFTVKPEDIIIESDIFEELLTKTTLSEMDKYYLICNLLISKKYCHYVINNKNVLSANRDIFEKYGPVFRYLMGYSWICMYMEECIIKTKTKQSNRYIFDINTASQLPIFPFDQSNPRTNPYFSMMVSDNIINTSQNMHGVRQCLQYQQGIVDLDEFKKRLNLFISGNENKDLLKGANWSNMVITGGIMSAIIPKLNPLMSLYKKTDNITYSELYRFFQEYYSDSDIDVACNHNNIIDFVEHVKNIKKNIIENLDEKVNDTDIIITPFKTLAVYINSDILKEKCESKEIPHDYDYVINHRNERLVKFYFYEMYVEKKNQANIRNKKILGDKLNDNEYFNIIDYCDSDKLSIVINDYKLEKNVVENKKPESNSGLELMYIVNKDKNDPDSDIFIKFSENLKYKISSKYLKHQFEVFRIVDDEFFGCISRFHLPCVRSYYNGDNCYMLPSAVTAYQTFTNIDFKYFVGTSDPIHIMDKYRKRGYGTILNKSEIKNYLSYIASFDKRKKAYHLQNLDKDISQIKNILGPLNINHEFFRPRMFIPEEFVVDPNIKLDYVISNLEYINNDTIKKYYETKYPKCLDIIQYTTINKFGTINQVKKWIIDAVYENLN